MYGGFQPRRGYSPNARHAPEVKLQMFDGEGLGQAEHQSALQMGAGGLLRTTSKDNVVIIQAVETVRSVTGWGWTHGGVPTEYQSIWRGLRHRKS